MKELTKTKRISVSVVGYIAIVLIGVLSLSKPTMYFTQNDAQIINEIEDLAFEVFPDEALAYIDDQDVNIAFVDVRNEYLFTKSHLPGAVNIPMNQLLDKANIEIFSQAKQDSVTLILYGQDQLEANGAWMILYQMGYVNLKVLLGGYAVISDPNFDPDLMEVYLVEEAAFDFYQIMEDAKASIENPVEEKTETRVHIIPVQRVENDIDEGGC